VFFFNIKEIRYNLSVFVRDRMKGVKYEKTIMFQSVWDKIFFLSLSVQDKNEFIF